MLYLTTVNGFIGWAQEPLVTLTVFGFYTIVYGAEMKASKAIAVIGLVNQLNGIIAAIPGWTNTILVWRSAYRRITIFWPGALMKKSCLLHP